MRTNGRFCVAGSLFIVLTTLAQTADAVPWRKVFFVFNQMDTGISLRKNYIGDGYDIQLNNTYNNRRYDFGLADLTLTGSVRTDLNLTKRVMPAIDIRSSTLNEPITYQFNINTGLQDYTTTGQITWDNSGSINALGFYDLTVYVSNRGSYQTEGYGLIDDGTTDFDLGPINISGNIYIDLLAAITEPFFKAANQPNPFSKISGRAAKSIVDPAQTDAIRAKIASGQALTDSEINAIIAANVLGTLLGQEVPSFNIDSTLASFNAIEHEISSPDQIAVLTSVPEPATFLVLGAPLLLWRRKRRV